MYPDISSFFFLFVVIDGKGNQASARGQTENDGALHPNAADASASLQCRRRETDKSVGDSAILRFGGVHQLTPRVKFAGIFG